MKRINVVGTSGSGKSTVSKRLAEKLGYPCYEMDALFWKPNWTESTDAELFDAVRQVTEQPCWVLDGNYNRTASIKWADADTIVWVDYSLQRTLYQSLRRSFSRCISGRELWPGTGNRETFRKSFFSRDSILLWTVKTYHKNRRRYLTLMEAEEYQHLTFICLRSPVETSRFLNSIQPEPSDDA
ncbi:AAA family ATPase [Parasalinivibrio latis]|uniref:AAA family ATPase n=1 Tax=Parasalinivibrio latis TaxID=2952610 RepID=UPI0030E32B55